MKATLPRIMALQLCEDDELQDGEEYLVMCDGAFVVGTFDHEDQEFNTALAFGLDSLRIKSEFYAGAYRLPSNEEMLP